MAVMTLEQLKLASRQRADKEHDAHIGEDELARYVNTSIAELYDLLTTAYGSDYFFESEDFYTTSGTAALPSNFYQLLGVDMFLSSSSPISLRQYNFNERNVYSNAFVRAFGRNSYRYRLQGNNIVILPQPSDSIKFTLHYIPRATILVSDLDEFDGYNGWEEYVIVNAAIAMLAKEESDTSRLDMELIKLKDRIEQLAHARNNAEPSYIQDVERVGGTWL